MKSSKPNKRKEKLIPESEIFPSSALWQKHDSVYHRNYDSIKSNKIAIIDLDGTLITTKSGKKYPENQFDWKLRFNSIPQKLQDAHQQGYKIVILTNQLGVSTGLVKLFDITSKIDDIQQEVKVPFHAFVLTADDIYRKPRIGCWKLIVENEYTNHQIEVKRKESYFVGDSAGRKSSSSKLKDHSDADVKFALNCKIQFYTPEKFFTNEEQPSKFTFDFYPQRIRRYRSEAAPPEWTSIPSKQEVILMYGSPASGKSTISKRYFSSYVRINQDELKTRRKCIEMYEEAINSGSHVIVDNTNRDRATRQPYIQSAKKLGIPVRAICILFSKAMCFHLNTFRMLTSPSTPKVPPIAIHSFFRDKEPPKLKEGFVQLIELDQSNFLAGPFNGDEEELFFSHLS